MEIKSPLHSQPQAVHVQQEFNKHCLGRSERKPLFTDIEKADTLQMGSLAALSEADIWLPHHLTSFTNTLEGSI